MPRLRPTSTEIRPISERDEEVLISLTLHGFLAFSQVRRLHLPGVSTTPARRTLRRLADRHLAANFFEATPVGRETVWYATTAGLEVAGLTLPALRDRRPSHVGRSKLAHTISVNEFGIRLVECARERGDEFGYGDWRNEVASKLPGGGLVIADAFMTYRLASGGRALRFLEMDLGTMPSMAVEEKYGRYVALWRSAAWKRQYTAFPKVATVVGGRRQNERLARLLAVAELARGRDGEPDLLFATADDVWRNGPLASIWRWTGDERPSSFLR